SVGIQYTLPMLFLFQTEVFSDGNLRLQLMREDIPVSKRLRMTLMYNTDKEYMLGMKYIMNKNSSINLHYDSDMGLGLGIILNY
ncbi:MAG: copper oxidase, partial [Bacteroidetes bacterium]|nr:copper oxidase [Bacteroidota bacterium]